MEFELDETSRVEKTKKGKGKRINYKYVFKGLSKSIASKLIFESEKEHMFEEGHVIDLDFENKQTKHGDEVVPSE